MDHLHELINQLLKLKSEEEFINWTKEHINELDDEFLNYLALVIEKYSTENEEVASYLKTIYSFLAHSASQAQAIPNKVAEIINDIKSSKINKQEALSKARDTHLTNQEVINSGQYLQKIAHIQPMPELAQLLAELLLIMAEKITDKKLKGMLIIKSCDYTHCYR